MTNNGTSLGQRPARLHELLTTQAFYLGGHVIDPLLARNSDGKRRLAFRPAEWVCCPLCGQPIWLANKETWDVDHITPRAVGGRDSLKNLQVTHIACHRLKTEEEREITQAQAWKRKPFNRGGPSVVLMRHWIKYGKVAAK